MTNVKPFFLGLLFILAATGLASCDSNDDDDGRRLRVATVQVAPTSATGSGVSGTVRVSEVEEEDALSISGSLRGLAEGAHGIHLHAEGDCSAADTGDPDDAPNPAGAAGPHYDTDGSGHGAPDDAPDARHFGDFGNINADGAGTADFDFTVERPEGVDFGTDVAGRALIVHSGRDDLETDPGGNSGTRLGCGIARE